MTDQHKDGGPAMPGPVYTQNGHLSGHGMGMSLRDWFAGQALAGYFGYCLAGHQNTATVPTAEYIYQMADAMIAARGAK